VAIDVEKVVEWEKRCANAICRLGCVTTSVEVVRQEERRKVSIARRRDGLAVVGVESRELWRMRWTDDGGGGGQLGTDREEAPSTKQMGQWVSD
jgi:hypothetical protein